MQLFLRYKDPQGDAILAEGVQQFCEDLGEGLERGGMRWWLACWSLVDICQSPAPASGYSLMDIRPCPCRREP